MSAVRYLATLAVLLYGGVAAGSGLDRLSDNSPSLERWVPGPFRAASDRAAATTAIVRQDGKAALGHAQAAVARDPVDPDSVALLGASYLLNENEQLADKAFRQAATFGWRNIATQVYWYRAAIGVGDLERAADRADALLRTHPLTVDQSALLLPFEEDPQGWQILVSHLGRRPGWLKGYLNVDANTPADVIDRRYRIVTDLERNGTRLGCDTIGTFTSTLLQQGRRSDAETLWNRNCPQDKLTGLIADPKFKTVSGLVGRQSPFSWHVHSSGNLELGSALGENGESVLALTNRSSRALLALSQPVAFPPGAYKFKLQTLRGASTAYISWSCDASLPYPDKTNGELTGNGQIVTFDECDRQRIGIWLGDRGTLAVESISFEPAGGSD